MILKLNVLLNKFLGALDSTGKKPTKLTSYQILQMDKSIQTAVGKNQIRVRLINVSMNQLRTKTQGKIGM